MTLSGTPSFDSVVAPTDALTFRDDATALPAADAFGVGGWMNLDYGYTDFYNYPDIVTFGTGLPADADRGREHVIVAGEIQAPWVLDDVTINDVNDLSFTVHRESGGMDAQARIVEFKADVQADSGGDISAPDGGGDQTYTATGAFYEDPRDVGRAVRISGGITAPGNNCLTTILAVISPTVIRYNNPGGALQAATDCGVQVGAFGGGGAPGTAMSVTLNGNVVPVSPTPALGDAIDVDQLILDLMALAIPDVEVYAGQGFGGSGRGRNLVVLGTGLASLSYAGSEFRFDGPAQARFWDPGNLSTAFPPASQWWLIAGGIVALEITTTSLPGGSVGAAYSQPVVATGGSGAGYAWVLASGTLPPGLALAASGTPASAITGTPTTPGVYPFVVRVTDDDANTDTQALTIIISAELEVLTIDNAGGRDLVYPVPLADGDYTAQLRDADEVLRDFCFSGVAGQGNTIKARAQSLSASSPAIEAGTYDVLVSLASGGDPLVLVEALIVMARAFPNGTYGLREMQPSIMATGPRRIEEEPLQ